MDGVLNIVLLGNYEPDQQHSMLGFCRVLQEAFCGKQIRPVILRPEPCVRKSDSAGYGLGKWLGYLDKYLLFPRRLKRELRRLRNSPQAPGLVHILDQANAVYLPCLDSLPHLVTCNDLLAIRSALGEFPDHPTRWSGRRLQGWILRQLKQARHLAAVSEATRQDVLRLTGLPPACVNLIPMGLNYPYRPFEPGPARSFLNARFRDRPIPGSFLLHVGGNQWYKNRLGLLDIYASLRRMAADVPPLVLAGKPFSPAMRAVARRLDLEQHVYEATGCKPEDLRALYSLADLMVFPSLAEGFGWPIIEAQACGCPVVTTRAAPMTEAGGSAAWYLNPRNPDEAATLLLAAITEPLDARSARIKAGFENAGRFSTEAMVNAYAALYAQILEAYAAPAS